MSYANGTTHYNLPQTVGTDKRDWFDTNQAFADIDEALYGAVQQSTSTAAAITALTTRVGEAESDIATIQASQSTDEANIAALQTLVSQHTTQIADVKADALDMICAVDEGTAQVASVAVSEGNYFRYNDVLYMATTDIAVGDTIVPNTNCRATNVATELVREDVVGLRDYTLATEVADGVKTLGTMLSTFNSYLSAMSENELSHSFIIVKNASTGEYNRYEFRMRGANNGHEFINQAYQIDTTYVNDVIREFSIAQNSTAFEVQNVYVRATGEFSLSRVTELDILTPTGNTYELHTLK